MDGWRELPLEELELWVTTLSTCIINLKYQEGDKILDVYSQPGNEGWSYGVVIESADGARVGKAGLFPLACIEVVCKASAIIITRKGTLNRKEIFNVRYSC